MLARRDVYANFFLTSRGLLEEQSKARESWFETLDVASREPLLFELEMLLKGIGCIGNGRNLPAAQKRVSNVAHDFRPDLSAIRGALERAVEITRRFLGQRERSFGFTQYLATVMPEDTSRARLIRQQLSQETPADSLFVLRSALSDQLTLIDGLLHARRITHRHFDAAHGSVVREVARSAYFNPLMSLEFRQEFDRIRYPEVLEAMHIVENDAAHQAVALTFLALFRLLRCSRLTSESASTEAGLSRSYVFMAALRSDARALVAFLTQNARNQIADGYGSELFRTASEHIEAQFDRLARSAESLHSLRVTLEAIGTSLSLETKRAFATMLPAIDAPTSVDRHSEIVVGMGSMGAALQDAIGQLCMEIAPEADPPELVESERARRFASQRLRRDVWMFSQIIRAFIAKAESARRERLSWSSVETFRFAREFIGHFRAIGYQLIRRSDYERLDSFMTMIDELSDVDLLESHRLARATAECQSFYRYLRALFDQISARAELVGHPFDEKAAASSLRAYLAGDS